MILWFKIAHLIGLAGLFLSLGAMFFEAPNKKAAGAIHGISLLLIVLAGFAMLGKPPAQAWWGVKMAIWLFLGAAPVLAKRKILPVPVVIGLSIASVGFAAWLDLAKPF